MSGHVEVLRGMFDERQEELRLGDMRNTRHDPRTIAEAAALRDALEAVADAERLADRINMALHWLDRYDVGIDEAQTTLDYVRDELEPPAADVRQAVRGEDGDG